MYRKSSGNYCHRSSQPKRLSALLLEGSDENKKPPDENKRTEMKRSMIPIARGSNRALSVEAVNEVGRPSSLDRETLAKRRAQSVERLNLCGSAAVTPKLKGLTPGSVITTTKRTGRRDTRILSDKAFQNSALCKVREYLLSEGLLDQGDVDDIGSKMTLKLFVNVMKVLLEQYFPDHDVNMSNYVEVLPFLLKKLKYSGKVARSWLITANATHSWQHVLGVMSWLVDLLSAGRLIWMSDEDYLDSEKIDKMHCFNAKRYREWSVGHTEAINGEDEEFFQDLMGDRIMYLKEEIKHIEEIVEDLEKQVNDSCVLASIGLAQQRKDVQKQLNLETEVERRTSQKLTSELQELKLEMQAIEKKIQEQNEQIRGKETAMKETLHDFGSRDALSQNNIKMKSEIVHTKHKIECHKSLIDDTNNQIYKDELSIAKTRKMLDKEQLSREALVRELLYQSPEAKGLENSISYAHPDAPKVMREYKTLLQKTLEAKGEDVDTINKKLAEFQSVLASLKEELEISQEEEKMMADQLLMSEKHLKEEIKAGAQELQQLELRISETENVIKQKHEDLELENADIAEKKDLVKSLEEEVNDMKKKNENSLKEYRENLQLMKQKLEDYMKKVIDAYEEHMTF